MRRIRKPATTAVMGARRPRDRPCAPGDRLEAQHREVPSVQRRQRERVQDADEHVEEREQREEELDLTGLDGLSGDPSRPDDTDGIVDGPFLVAGERRPRSCRSPPDRTTLPMSLERRHGQLADGLARSCPSPRSDPSARARAPCRRLDADPEAAGLLPVDLREHGRDASVTRSPVPLDDDVDRLRRRGCPTYSENSSMSTGTPSTSRTSIPGFETRRCRRGGLAIELATPPA